MDISVQSAIKNIYQPIWSNLTAKSTVICCSKRFPKGERLRQ